MGKNGRSGWALRRGVELEGCRPRQRVRVEEIDDDVAQIVYVNLQTDERVRDVIAVSNLEKVPLASECGTGVRGVDSPGPWTAVELGAALALARSPECWPTQAQKVLARIAGAQRTTQAVATATRSLTGDASTKFSRKLARVVTDYPLGTSVPDLRDSAIPVKLGRIPGISEFREVLIAARVNGADLEGTPRETLAGDSGNPPQWSPREIAIAIALRGYKSPFVARAIREIAGVRRSEDAVWATLDKIRHPKKRTKSIRRVLSRAGVGLRKCVPDDVDLTQVLEAADLAEVERRIAKDERKTDDLALGWVPETPTPDRVFAAAVPNPVDPESALEKIRELLDIRPPTPVDPRTLAVIRALDRALTRACAGQTAVADAHFETALRWDSALPQTSAEARVLLGIIHE